ncbi:hypothetical protein RIF23_05095 [Lipingzhangella sp. LS1_29]|uniref:Uncharacterized protein n=1 Tax=Lipingzhangella rawalii TaxID=2055835 RepID=A0ABU2H2Y4_9ACTN|nr:hypothetical protein [Lipingzhangella rawalii]MDS1269665.1 hypothetical protein [Lipingzhangella rawalii]
MARMARSAASLPLYTLDLARRYWAPLLFVYLLGTLLHGLMLRGIVWLGLQNQTLGLLAFSLAVLVTLATTIVMFLMLRPGLPVLDHELLERSRRARGTGADQRPNVNERERRIVDAVAMSLLPFLIFYSAWGLFAEELRAYAARAQVEAGLDGYVAILDFNPLGVPLLVLAVAFLCRTVCEQFYFRNNSKALGIATAFFETVFAFFFVVTVVELASTLWEWLGQRLVWVEATAMFHTLLEQLAELTALPVIDLVLGTAAAVVWTWELLKDGLIQPLLWLTIAAVVFGADVDRTETLFRPGSRAQRVHDAALARTPGVLLQLGERASRGLREKYLPFLNAFRFILRTSPIYYLSFCLYYALLELGFSWLERGVLLAVGPADFLGWWWPWLAPLSIAVDALHEVLRVCLLAATFEVVLRRMLDRQPGQRARPARI